MTPTAYRFFRRLTWFAVAIAFGAALIYFSVPARGESDHDRIVKLEARAADLQYVAGVNYKLSEEIAALRHDLAMSTKSMDDRYGSLEKIGWTIVVGLIGNIVAMIVKATWGGKA